MKEFFETQTRDKSDQKSAIQKNFVILTMVIMNTKEATADFCLLTCLVAFWELENPMKGQETRVKRLLHLSGLLFEFL